MDILQARESLNSDSDQLYYNSDEFMMEDLVKSPGRSELEKSLITNTSNALEIIRSPPTKDESIEFRKKLTPAPKDPADLRLQMHKAGSFCGKLSDGIIVKPNLPKPAKHLSLKSLSPRRSPKASPKSAPVRRRHSDFEYISTPQSQKQSLDCSHRSEGAPAPLTPTIDELEEGPMTVPPPSAPVQESKSWVSSGSEWSDDLSDSSSVEEPLPHLPLRRMRSEPPLPVSLPSPMTKLERMKSVPEDKDDAMQLPPPPPPPTMMSFSPYNNALHKRSLQKHLRQSASARLESTAETTALVSNSSRSHEKRLSFQVDDGAHESPSMRKHRKRHSSNSSQSPKADDKPARRTSSWLVSPGDRTPKTPRSRKFKSSSSSSRHKSHLNMTGIPKVPLFDHEQEQDHSLKTSPKTSPKAPFSRRKLPPVMRPLDKTLMRGDYPSNNTATTFLTADTDAVDYSMSHMFPLTKETTRLILKKAPNKRDLLIETPQGEFMGSIDYSMVNQGKRLIKDSLGRTCALVFLQGDKLNCKKVFKICGNKPASRTQRLSNETGYYTWAEVRNSGSLGGKFVMSRFCPQTITCSAEQHTTKPFGSLFSRGKSKGYVFLDDHKKECVKMVSLKNGKGIIVGPNRDLCLMLGYAACVAEMVELRLR